MSSAFKGWKKVHDAINDLVPEQPRINVERSGSEITKWCQADEPQQAEPLFNEGQCRSLRAIANRLPTNGVILADEVGMGKTRIAAAVALAVQRAGGRVAFLIPPGLGAQWKAELSTVGLRDVPDVLRSLDGFFAAWREGNSDEGEPSARWYEKKAVLISHAFANWRLGESTQTWGWAVLPLAWSEWQKRIGGKPKRRTSDLLESLGRRASEIERAAEAIARASRNEIGEVALRRRLEVAFRGLDWGEARRGSNYTKEGDYRTRLASLVGVGLGTFDLLVIDEAHKSRSEDTVISRFLQDIVCVRDDGRRIAMTATPVDIDGGQWSNTLSRIGLQDTEKLKCIQSVCDRYAEALLKISQTWRTSEQNRHTFKVRAKIFEVALGDYVLRRDKREDELIRYFSRLPGESIDSYRREIPIEIEPTQLKPRWLDALIAAEGLAAISTQGLADGQDEKRARQDKRLRLTIGNGHGLNSVIDSAMEAGKGGEQDATEGPHRDASEVTNGESARANYWRNLLKRSLTPNGRSDDNALLYEHPAILAAAKETEVLTAAGRKVLIFGRYTQPMAALEELLNARSMLCHLSSGRFWPQRKTSASKTALRAAISQWQGPGSWSLDAVMERLREQYDAFEKKTAAVRSKIHAVVKDHYPKMRQAATLLTRAVLDLLPPEQLACPSKGAIVECVQKITHALSDQDRSEIAIDPVSTEENQDNSDLTERIVEEYGMLHSPYARRLHGATKPHSRRNLQLLFNREHCFPQVLIAQSTVGREGLNLHEACRDVILLHPEWNPGVVEQQIGRVDRLHSRWAKDFCLWQQERQGEPPRIEIRPIIFKGTYDEHNWAVLRERWALLRGQLHGIIVSETEMRESPVHREFAEELNRNAPRLSPP